MLLKLEYRYHSGDIDEVFRSVRSRTWKRTRLRLAMVTIVFILCLVIFYWLDRRSQIPYLLLGFYLGVVSVVWAVWQAARKQGRGIWKAYPVLQYKFTVEIDDESIRTSCDIASVMRRWECFTGYFESASLFHIQEGQRGSLWIPKRAFTSDADLSQMRELLHSKLPCTNV
jgi:hypothetical protein